jgi:antitoxin component of RelBE/YafQ-DinJ toxin-antitoxin module
MSIGSSGRIVIEIDPELKRELYSVLTREGLTLKDWFVRNAAGFVAESSQLPLRLEANEDMNRGRL